MTQLHRSDCPVARALDVVGDKWTLLLIRDMLAGKETYQKMLAAGEGIPTNVLAARLKRLVSAGLVEKHAYQERPRRFAYRLTEAGRDLMPVVASLETWGAAQLGGVIRRQDRIDEPTPAPPEAPKPQPKQSEWAFGPEDSVW